MDERMYKREQDRALFEDYIRNVKSFVLTEFNMRIEVKVPLGEVPVRLDTGHTAVRYKNAKNHKKRSRRRTCRTHKNTKHSRK